MVLSIDPQQLPISKKKKKAAANLNGKSLQDSLEEAVGQFVDLVGDLGEEAEDAELLAGDGEPERILGRLLAQEVGHLLRIQLLVVLAQGLLHDGLAKKKRINNNNNNNNNFFALLFALILPFLAFSLRDPHITSTAFLVGSSIFR